MPSKRYKKALEVVDAKKAYPLKDAVGVLGKFPKAKFNETIDLAFRLGVDPKQSDQMVRGAGARVCQERRGGGRSQGRRSGIRWF
jgi:large subunit ribosomal protein L1